MFTKETIFPIIDSAMKDISNRVAKVQVTSLTGDVSLSADDPFTIFSTTKGDYTLTVVFCTDYCVLQELTHNMKRNGEEVSEEEISIYMKEFFNILCGHIISAVNRTEHLCADFGVPNFVKGCYKEKLSASIHFHGQYYYDSPYGRLKLETLCRS